MQDHIALPTNPVIYEINTWVWLRDLKDKYGKKSAVKDIDGKEHSSAALTLATIPTAEWDAIAGLGIDAVWLMGVWQRSPAGREIALHTDVLLADFMHVLPDFTIDDVVGSPYCIRTYEVDDALGGRDALAAARSELAQRGIALLLDFVPNHVAPDHPWTLTNPEYFVQGSDLEGVRTPEEFLSVGSNVYARGRDPYFAPWQDVVQLNAFAPGLRQEIIATLRDIATQCDGVRCDMAMLMNSEIFAKTWGDRAGAMPAEEYWAEILAGVKAQHPNFVWIAEVYWDMEWRMQQLGFDYCYDKRLYDRLVVSNLGAPGTVEFVAGHLHADAAYQQKLVRFSENHDEPRAVYAFPAERLRAVMLANATQMGARLFHEGQFEGRRVKVNVFLGRRPYKIADRQLQAWSYKLLKGLRTPVLHTGQWQLCKIESASGPASNVIAWCWYDAQAPASLAIVAVNLSDQAERVRITGALSSAGAATSNLHLTDVFDADETLALHPDNFAQDGVIAELAPWAARFWIAQP